MNDNDELMGFDPSNERLEMKDYTMQLWLLIWILAFIAGTLLRK